MTKEEFGEEDKKGKSERSTYTESISKLQKKQKRDYHHLFPVSQNNGILPLSSVCIGLKPQDPVMKFSRVTPSSKDKMERVGNRYHYGPENNDNRRSSSSKPHRRVQKRNEVRSSNCREGL